MEALHKLVIKSFTPSLSAHPTRKFLGHTCSDPWPYMNNIWITYYQLLFLKSIYQVFHSCHLYSRLRVLLKLWLHTEKLFWIQWSPDTFYWLKLSRQLSCLCEWSYFYMCSWIPVLFSFNGGFSLFYLLFPDILRSEMCYVQTSNRSNVLLFIWV